QPLSEHDVPHGTEKGVVETGRLKWPRAVGAAPGYALRVTDSAKGSTEYPSTFLHNLTHTTPNARPATNVRNNPVIGMVT
ncbi:hypothetical protein, partial [Propionivibrio sp.]|uniref:hypothetical protein n=1 Tax=Propionivibrio sp. TaxID=2212460 RepID=UPI00272E3339